jgi:hypothetical protein
LTTDASVTTMDATPSSDAVGTANIGATPAPSARWTRRSSFGRTTRKTMAELVIRYQCRVATRLAGSQDASVEAGRRCK